MFSNRLCNPTPFEVEWHYDRGVHFKVPADGYYDLPSTSMVQDFSPTTPGTENIQELMGHFGIFLHDPSRTYEEQAYEALERSIKMKRQLYQGARDRMQQNAAMHGRYDEEAFNVALENHGYNRLLADIKKLEKRLSKYQKVVKASKRVTLHEQFDPEKTLLFLNPPKVFMSKLALETYLDENPDHKAQYEAQMERFRPKAKTAKAVAENE